MMKTIIILVLAGCAVCGSTGNQNTAEKVQRDPFKAYWNVPTMQCKFKRLPFEGLYEKYGIIQNKGDSFRGEAIALLYDPGSFPALFLNESTGKFRFRNGGVPQEGDMDKHLAAFKKFLEVSVPDPEFSGLGVIDFESWRPIFRQNSGVLIPYRNISWEIERKRHPSWTEEQIKDEAKKRFEEAGEKYMFETLSLAKKLRPRALWGYYAYPYCFNMGSHHMFESCAKNVPAENDRLSWLWKDSLALYPSVYSSKDLQQEQLAGLVRGRVLEAARVGHGIPIIPYFWFRYRDGDYFSQDDLETAIKTMYDSNASGVIIWGSSKDIDSEEKCIKLHKYLKDIMGPILAKYAKQN
nr:venom protein U-MPTX.13-30 [Megalopyge opercularis]